MLLYFWSAQKLAKLAQLMLVESQFYVWFLFADGILVGKVAKVAYFSGVEECDRCLRFILVYVLSVAKVAEIAELMGVEGVVQCLFNVCSGLLGK